MAQKLKILHLEDLPTDADLVARELRRGTYDFDLLLVDNKEDFIKSLKTFAPDIVLSDHSLPTLDSREALRLLKQEKITVPFILITATVSEEYAVEIMKMGAYDYILKDRLQRLPNAVNNALEKARIEKDRETFLKKIIASETLLKKTEALAHMGSFFVDIEKQIIRWSDELYRMLGYDVDTTKPSIEKYLSKVHSQDVTRVRKVIIKAINGSDTDFVELQFRLQIGNEIRYIHGELMVERNEANEPRQITGFNQDITAQKKAEEKFIKSEANLFTIFENTDTGYILFDAEVNIVSFNKPAQKFADEDFNKPLVEGQPGVDFFLDEKITQALGNNHYCEINYPQKNGAERWYYIRYLPILNKKQKFGWVMALTDFTERKVTEIQRDKIATDLFRQNKDLEQFAYIVSHNLRAPVANIIGLSKVLERTDLDDKIKIDVQSGLSQAAMKLDEVIMDLNSVLQVKQKSTEKKTIVKFDEVINDIISSIQNIIEKDDVKIIMDFSEVNKILTLKSYLYSIFYNIIINSIKYKQLNLSPVIYIKSKLTEHKIELTFKDNGMGIDLVKKGDQVFKLYKRFHSDIEGKGMGLFMIKTQVESLNGSISIQSEVNQGTELKIEFEVPSNKQPHE